MSDILKPPIPQKMDLYCLADRWGIPHSSAPYMMAEFINTDHLWVMVRYKGYFGFTSCYLDEEFKSPRHILNGDWFDEHYGWQFKGNFEHLKKYQELRQKVDLNAIGRGGEPSPEENENWREIYRKEREILEKKPFYFPDEVQGKFYGHQATATDGLIHFKELFYFEGGEHYNYKFINPIESRGEKQEQEFRYVGLTLSLRDIFVLKDDLMGFEQFYRYFNHGLKRTYLDPLDKSESETVGPCSDKGKKQIEREEQLKKFIEDKGGVKKVLENYEKAEVLDAIGIYQNRDGFWKKQQLIKYPDKAQKNH